jgi:hypothetical protein
MATLERVCSNRIIPGVTQVVCTLQWNELVEQGYDDAPDGCKWAAHRHFSATSWLREPCCESGERRSGTVCGQHRIGIDIDLVQSYLVTPEFSNIT